MAAGSKHVGRGEEVLELWYALGRLYSRAASARRRATRLGFTITLLSGAVVLLSVPFLGTAASRAGLFVPALPVLLGLLSGFGMFGVERFLMRRRESSIADALSGRGFDAKRPALRGLSAYYDAQLILLRSEYEYFLLRGASRSSRLFEESFGFTPEDPFETGPLNVMTDTEEMGLLRKRWERRISMRRERGMEPPEVGLREDRAYGVFPREMTVPAEMAVREAYLTISRDLIRKRYGRNPTKTAKSLPETLRKRIKRDLGEYARLTGKSTGRRYPGTR